MSNRSAAWRYNKSATMIKKAAMMSKCNFIWQKHDFTSSKTTAYTESSTNKRCGIDFECLAVPNTPCCWEQDFASTTTMPGFPMDVFHCNWSRYFWCFSHRLSLANSFYARISTKRWTDSQFCGENPCQIGVLLGGTINLPQ